jgi:hypothetical protein
LEEVAEMYIKAGIPLTSTIIIPDQQSEPFCDKHQASYVCITRCQWGKCHSEVVGNNMSGTGLCNTYIT